MAYTIQRSGDFYAVPMGDVFCGEITRGEAHRFTYTVRCEGSNVDSRGFLMDQVDIRSMFDAIGEYTESCELLAKRMAEQILRASRQLDSVMCSISPAPNLEASFTATRAKLPARKLANARTSTAKVSASYADDYQAA
jgi:hypothetical protein